MKNKYLRVVSGFFSIKDIMNQALREDSQLEKLDAQQLERLQTCLLSIYMDVKKACERCEIKPVLVGGSALGAERHGGFIPWDDDFDLGMSRKDYNIFIRHFDELLGDRYILKAPNYHGGSVNRFAQIYQKGTVYRTVEMTNPETPFNISVDLFQIDNVPDSKVYRLLKGVWCNLLMAIGGQVAFYKFDSKIMKPLMLRNVRGRINYLLKVASGFVFSFFPPSKWFDLVDKNVQFQKSGRYCTIATGRKHYFGELCPIESFFPFRSGLFEKREVYLLNCPDIYLKNLYGSYREIPPIEKRESHYALDFELGRDAITHRDKRE